VPRWSAASSPSLPCGRWHARSPHGRSGHPLVRLMAFPAWQRCRGAGSVRGPAGFSHRRQNGGRRCDREGEEVAEGEGRFIAHISASDQHMYRSMQAENSPCILFAGRSCDAGSVLVQKCDKNHKTVRLCFAGRDARFPRLALNSGAGITLHSPRYRKKIKLASARHCPRLVIPPCSCMTTWRGRW
jgi:hypothetical protein